MQKDTPQVIANEAQRSVAISSLTREIAVVGTPPRKDASCLTPSLIT